MSKTANPEAPAETPVVKKGLSTKLKIGGIIAAVMILELVAMIFLLPRGGHADAAADSEQTSADDHHGHVPEHKTSDKGDGHGGKEAKGHGKKDDHSPSVPSKGANESEEIDLGEFSVTSYQPAASTTLFISFHLFGTLQHKNSEDLSRRLDDNKHRIRDNIIVIIRSAEITDLTDAGLGLIKRRILETTNKTLGKPLLQAVVFSDFSFVEQ